MRKIITFSFFVFCFILYGCSNSNNSSLTYEDTITFKNFPSTSDFGIFDSDEPTAKIKIPLSSPDPDGNQFMYIVSDTVPLLNAGTASSFPSTWYYHYLDEYCSQRLEGPYLIYICPTIPTPLVIDNESVTWYKKDYQNLRYIMATFDNNGCATVDYNTMKRYSALPD